MSKMKLKLTLAGMGVACVFTGIAMRIAWATPGVDILPTLIAGPVLLDEIDVHVNGPAQSLKIKSQGQWTQRFVHFDIGPGGDTGWHSHPGPVFVTVTAGTLTVYEGDDPTPSIYPAGTGFVEQPGQVNIGRNEADEGHVELVTLFLTPLGEPIRIDEPAP